MHDVNECVSSIYYSGVWVCKQHALFLGMSVQAAYTVPRYECVGSIHCSGFLVEVWTYYSLKKILANPMQKSKENSSIKVKSRYIFQFGISFS